MNILAQLQLRFTLMHGLSNRNNNITVTHRISSSNLPKTEYLVSDAFNWGKFLLNLTFDLIRLLINNPEYSLRSSV